MGLIDWAAARRTVGARQRRGFRDRADGDGGRIGRQGSPFLELVIRRTAGRAGRRRSSERDLTSPILW